MKISRIVYHMSYVDGKLCFVMTGCFDRKAVLEVTRVPMFLYSSEQTVLNVQRFYDHRSSQEFFFR